MHAQELVSERSEGRPWLIWHQEGRARRIDVGEADVCPASGPVGRALPLEREWPKPVGICDARRVYGKKIAFSRRRVADDRSAGRGPAEQLADREIHKPTGTIAEAENFDIAERVNPIGHTQEGGVGQNRRHGANRVVRHRDGAVIGPRERVVVDHVPEHRRVDVASLTSVQDFPNNVELVRNDHAIHHQLEQ